ncbi:hypothetical protein GCM10010994_35230 [Chelatococcus reniformis]|uniref:DUF4440 domain-containing protein n=2 Tax=Chelatococcus reniformis TaxID=1494448 RepID=A0A916XHK4_9HYPH|nr:hypothetical protein GCM10010994_35230 [Chelatococcus reniformis]
MLLCAPVAAWGQTTNVQDDPITQQILALREKIRTAIARKDRAALEALYDDRFNHIRENGRTDLKRERIDLLLSGQDGIEIAPDDQMLIQAYGPDTVVLSGVSPIKDRRNGKSAQFQWLTVYVKTDGAWKVAVSQANRVPKPR